MKHLLALMALCVAFAAGAQTGLVEFPYNPDADNDDLIGINDLMELLSLYGSEFTEEGLFLNDESNAALYYTGQLSFYRCFKSCKELTGRWSMPTYEKMLSFELSILPSYLGWIQSKDMTAFSQSGDQRVMRLDSEGDFGRTEMHSMYNNVGCYCATHERPKVEYSYCEGSNIQECADSKVAEGWYPLGGISYSYHSGGWN